MSNRRAYSEDFLDFVDGKTFHNPETGNRVVFESLPESEKAKVHERWDKFKPDAPEGKKLRKNQHGEQYVDDSPYAERMSEYLSPPSKKYERETKIWNTVRDWAVEAKPTDHEMESFLMAVDSGHVPPPESHEDADDLARRLGLGKHRRTGSAMERVSLLRRKVREAAGEGGRLRRKMARRWRSLNPAQRAAIRTALADEG